MTTVNKSRPSLPSLLAKPLSLIPGPVHATLIAKAVNRLLAAQIAEGDLDFMKQRCLRVEIIDAGISFDLFFDGRRLLAATRRNPPALTLRGHLYDFMLLASRREDSDTLFFQRRLQVEGDTELGLGIKNFLDAIEIESLPFYPVMDGFLGRAVHWYERLG